MLHWCFQVSWDGFLPWRIERHLRLVLFSDASLSGWGGGEGCLESPGVSPSRVRGLWDDYSRALPIATKETQALLNKVEALLSSTRNAHVDAFVDNKVLLACWEKQVSRSPVISEIF